MSTYLSKSLQADDVQIWLVPAGIAMAVLLGFALLFRDRQTRTE